MRKFLLIIITINSLSAFAKKHPTFTCTDRDGFSYEFFIPDYAGFQAEIRTYDEKNKYVETIKQLHHRFDLTDTIQPIEEYRFSFIQGIYIPIAKIIFYENSDIGFGTMIRENIKIKCTRK